MSVRRILGVAALLVLSACGGGGGGGNPTPANAPPTANAGAAQTVLSGATVTLNGTASSDSDGTIASYAWTQVLGGAVTLSGASTAQPSFVAPTVVSATTLRFSLVVTDDDGAASSAMAVDVTVNPPPVTNVSVTGLIRFTRVPFLNVSPFGLDHANQTLQPARGVVVRALDAGSQELATGVTDASGNYSLSVPPNTTITIQVVARMLRDTSQPAPRWDVRVQNGTGSLSAYTHSSAAFNSNVGAQNIDIPSGLATNGTATGGVRASGPFAILDSIYTAMQTVLGAAPATIFPALYVDWGNQAVGTFFSTSSGQHIALTADLAGDTDEFDQHVVVHEFGHYLEFNFSRSDSIGGSHALGDRLDMRVSFGEGFGYAFAAIALNDPIVRDSFNNNGTQAAGGFNAEINPATNPPGQFGDQIGCWCSESSVWAILYDLYDSTTPLADVTDGVALGFAPIWQVLTGAQRNTPAFTSIFSFITALKAARPAEAAAINTLVAAQNIDAATIDAFATSETHVPTTPHPANVPFTGVLPIFTNVTAGTPVVVRSSDDGGRYNKAGNRRFLRFAPSVTGTVTLTLTTSNVSGSPDPDYLVFNGATVVAIEDDPPPQPETGTFSVTSGQTYAIDAFDCANGCSTVQGTTGDYDLTVTIN